MLSFIFFVYSFSPSASSSLFVSGDGLVEWLRIQTLEPNCLGPNPVYVLLFDAKSLRFFMCKMEIESL